MQQKVIHCNLLYSLVLMSENAVIFMSYPVNQLFILFLYTVQTLPLYPSRSYKFLSHGNTRSCKPDR